MELWDTWWLRSPLLPSNRLGASDHVATLDLFFSRWRARCLGARGDNGVPSWWVARSMPRGTWWYRIPLLTGGGGARTLTPGAGLMSCDWSFKSYAQWYSVCMVPTVFSLKIIQLSPFLQRTTSLFHHIEYLTETGKDIFLGSSAKWKMSWA
jgi:hypothetical protein